MSESKAVEQVTESFFDGFTDLFQNKHFWMIVFVVASVATGYYYFNTYFNNSEEKQTEQPKLENSTPPQGQLQEHEIQDLIRRGILVPVNQPQQMEQQMGQQQMGQQMEQVPQHVEESRQVEEQNLTQEELNMIKQQLDTNN